MTKTIGAERFNTRKIQEAKLRFTESERREKAREKVLEATKKEAERYQRLTLPQARSALLVALDRSEPLRLLFVARYLGMGKHRDELADILRVRFGTACYAGDHRGAKRAQEALGALLQKERAFFTCNCEPVEVPTMTMCL